MNRSLNTQHPIAAAYEPPQMTVVPIRASGAMLVGSMLGTSYREMEVDLWQFENITADNYASSYDDGWDYSFD